MNIKKLIIIPVLTICTLVFFMAACSTPAEKVASAEANVNAANKALNDANAAQLAEMEAYRKEVADKIAANNASIAAFNARVESEKSEAKADYRNKIAALEQKNTDMKKRLDDYKADGKDKWEIFKAEFGRDMDELGKAFKDLTVNNVK
jgi:chromosome segregation ATPase